MISKIPKKSGRSMKIHHFLKKHINQGSEPGLSVAIMAGLTLMSGLGGD